MLEERVRCDPLLGVSKGFFFEDNPFRHPTSVFMVQIAMSTITTGFMHFLLKPFGHCFFFSYMLGAIIIGPSGIGNSYIIRESLFGGQSLHVLETLQNIATIFFVFLVGLKMDIEVVIRSGKRCWIRGIVYTVMPFAFSLPVSYILKTQTSFGKELGDKLSHVAVLESTSSFHVIGSVLADLKLLNSEIGRQAVALSTISGLINLGIASLTPILSTTQTQFQLIGNITSFFVLGGAIVCLIRPLMLWMIRQTPEGQNIKECHMFIIFVMILSLAAGGHILGQRLLYGPIMLGMVIPPGPPLASSIENKVHTFYSAVLLPLHFLAAIGYTDLYIINPETLLYVVPVILLAYIGKLASIMLPSLYLKMSFRDALSLGLVMCSQGILDVVYIRGSAKRRAITYEMYTIMVYTAVLSAGIIAPLVSTMYQPSSRFFVCKRRNIGGTKGDSEFRIVAYVYHEVTAPSIINLIEASNPKIQSPISLCLLHLIELQGLSTPILVPHSQYKPSSIQSNQSKHIIHAFESYEKTRYDTFFVQCFISMAPFATMHEDICTLALDRETSLIIVPFHRQVNSDGLTEFITPIRNVNRNVLSIAPCSVGILVEPRSSSGSNGILGSKSLYRIAVIFLGGPDDREALSYGMRMSEHSNVNLTVVRLFTREEKSYVSEENDFDNEVLDEFRYDYMRNDHITLREEVVSDGVGTIKVIQSLRDNCDLIMVGRYHSDKSPLVSGLAEWNEFPELGHIGDLLATSDMGNEISVLVLQQQPYGSQDVLVGSSHMYHSGNLEVEVELQANRY